MGNGAPSGADEALCHSTSSPSPASRKSVPATDTAAAAAGGSGAGGVPSKPSVSCSSIRGKVSVAPLDLSAAAAAAASSSSADPSGDHTVANQANLYLGTAGAQEAASASAGKVFRIPDGHDMAEGEKKLVRCGGRAVAVFRLENTWAAIDNACYHHGGPLFMGDIEDYNEQACVVCPWHCTKIALGSGVSMYNAFDVQTEDSELVDKKGGARQRVHQVIERQHDVLIRLNPAPHLSYASDRYAVQDIASNNEELTSWESVSAEACGREKREADVQKRRASRSMEMKREKEQRRRRSGGGGGGPVRVPAGQLTPRADANKGAFVPGWVRRGQLPPELEEGEAGSDGDDDDWSPAYDLAEEFMGLEAEYEGRREKADNEIAAKAEAKAAAMAAAAEQ
eukprot:Rhum_TRINITY_DN9109_c0_g1::Rhum_TRINITY_DN9109_c0_g1_i1::g.31601::m.31601